MSLINEALKRAKGAQIHRPAFTGSDPALQPAVETISRPAPGTWLIAGSAMVLLFAALWCLSLWWKGSHWRGTAAAVPRLVKSTEAMKQTLAQVANHQAATKSDDATSVVTKPSSSHSNTNSVAMAAPAARVETNHPTALETSSSPTNASFTPLPMPSPKPNVPVLSAADEELLTKLKVQGIFYRSARPSAMIDGQAVFVGDQIQGVKVVGIDRQSVRVSLNGITNVLSMK